MWTNPRARPRPHPWARALCACLQVAFILAGLSSPVLAEAWFPRNTARFTVLLPGGDMVLDRETNLIWMRDPSQVTQSQGWEDARETCLDAAVGGRKGWRLPTAWEATSLFVVADPVGPTFQLPPFHPFLNIPVNIWTSTIAVSDTVPAPGDPTSVVFLRVTVVPVGEIGTANANTENRGVWCVRGPG